MWLYLVDELTGKPVVPEEDDATYPILITKANLKVVEKLLPIMQVGLHAASLINGVAGVVRLFGYPCPKVPEAWRAGAQGSVEILKQESSVEQFAAVHEKVQEGDEATETTRGGALRDLEDFINTYDKKRDYAGLRRIGDPNDGTAVWTRLTDPKEVKAALEARAKERRAERKRAEADYAAYLREKAAGGDASADAGGATAATTAAPAAGSGPSAVRALTAAPREAGDPEALRRVEDRLTGIEEQLGAIRSIEAAVSRSLLRLSQ